MQVAKMVLGVQRRRQEERLGKRKPLEVFKASQSLLPPAPTPNWQFRRAHTRMSRQAAFSRVIWSAMVKLVKPGRRLANSTILIMHLVASSLNLSQRPRSSRTRWSALEFYEGEKTPSGLISGKPNRTRRTQHVSDSCAGSTVLIREIPGGAAEFLAHIYLLKNAQNLIPVPLDNQVTDEGNLGS